MIARLAYAALFVIALPLLLAAWARTLDAQLSLPELRSPVAGGALVATGLLFMLGATRDLWVHGHGLPASPFPPLRLVTRGFYALLRDPIYVGAVMATAGASLIAGSPAGLWIVTPVLAAACTAFVWGFERDATRRRYGALGAPLLHVPHAVAGAPDVSDRIGTVVLVLLPWLVLFVGIETLGAGAGAISTVLPIDARIPVIPWTEGLYAITYPYVLLVAAITCDRRVLARFARDGLAATAFIIPIYLLVPLVAEAKPVPPGDGLWHSLLRWERLNDAPVTACPAFHVTWICLATEAWVARWPRARAAWLLLATAQVTATVTTGMHAVVDIAGGLGAWWLVRRRHQFWMWLRQASEVVANSGAEATLGPLRVATHGIYAGLAAAVGLGVAMAFGGPALRPWMAGLFVAAVAGASVWAQVVEGSPQLLRPYGYYGSVIAVVLLVLLAAWLGADGWLLGAAFAVGASFAQGLGRIRCLVNGCCHGRSAPTGVGIVVTNPLSRVVRLAALDGTPVHATQLYALLWLVLVGMALVRLWVLAAPLGLILGAYFVLTGLGRFVEEHYRGEPQTVEVAGLRLYQWLAIAAVIGGAAVSAMHTRAAPTPPPLHAASFAFAVGAGLFAFVAYGVDWPGADRRYSRLR